MRHASAQQLRYAATPISERPDSLDPLIQRIGNARFVLIGEASHGTDEFYETRSRITKRLVQDHGFNMVVAEADWPEAYRVNRYVRGFDDDPDADSALSGFLRFPQWMWRNTVVLDFVTWLRDINHVRQWDRDRCGFYGMDLYGLYGSIREVLGYLEKVDPGAADRARARYGCFEQFGPDPQQFALAPGLGLDRGCEDEVVHQLIEMRERAAEYVMLDGRLADDEHFYAQHNALLVRNAEEYYRTMFAGHVESWNKRDRHMMQTLGALEAFWRDRIAPQAVKMVVWAHNSHLGDARATDMGAVGEINVSQLAREKWGAAVYNIGFTTYTGTVTAARDWGDVASTMQVNPALPGSYEELFHALEAGDFLLFPGQAWGTLSQNRLERAIGVVYHPETERQSHYFHASLADQFDAVLHLDRTRAVRPLEKVGTPTPEPETFPTGV